MTETELEKKWENTVWDTDVYLDDIDDWGVCKDCAIKDKCSNYKPCKRQCEDYEEEPQTNFEKITKSEESLAEWLAFSGYGSCVHYDCETCEFYDKKLDDCIDGWDISHEKKRWVEWLKQPHTVKE